MSNCENAKEKSKERILGRRIHFPLTSVVVGYIILTVLDIVAFVLCIIFVDERFPLAIIGAFELLFTIVFLCDYLPKRANNQLRDVVITTDEESIIVYKKTVKLFIPIENVYDLNYKNKKSVTATPYVITEKEYNYGRIMLYYYDDDKEAKLTVKNVANPDRVFEKIGILLGWDQEDPEEYLEEE